MEASDFVIDVEVKMAIKNKAGVILRTLNNKWSDTCGDPVTTTTTTSTTTTSTTTTTTTSTSSTSSASTASTSSTSTTTTTSTTTPTTTTTSTTTTQGQMIIPASRPRLWFNSTRLAAARAWWNAGNSFTPGNPAVDGGYAAQQNAFAYLMTGNVAYANAAIAWAVGYKIPADELSGQISDNARWNGEYVMLVFDWCHDQISADNKKTIIDRWNTYVALFNSASWGGIGFRANNYYWGYLRNSAEWGITSFGENLPAQGFIDNALNTRYRNDFTPWASTRRGRGGVMWEGSNYGSYCIWYPVIPFDAAQRFGRDVWAECNVFKEGICCLLYSTTPKPTYEQWNGNSEYQMFYFSDISMGSGEYRSLYRTSEVGDTATKWAMNWASFNLGKFMRHWLNTVVPNRNYVFKSTDVVGSALDYASVLPNDYYAIGSQYFYTRNNWTTGATLCMIQLGIADSCSHKHLDAGAFQIWRNGRWLSRTTAGYSNVVPNHMGTGTKDVLHTIATNGLLFHGQGLPLEHQQRVSSSGQPVVSRLESNTNHSYIVADMSDTYTYTNNTTYGNPYALRATREFLFLRPIETLVVLDRLESKASGAVTAANVIKTFLLHSETNPIIEDANHVRIENGSEVLRLTTLLPSVPTYRIVNEKNTFPTYGQFRLEVDTSGVAQTYLLNILQSRSSGGLNVNASVVDTGSAFILTLTLASYGSIQVVFMKGMSSTGGTVTFSSGGAINLRSNVQGISVTNDGPVWAP